MDLRAEDETAYAVYDDFLVEAEDNNFRLRLGHYRGNAGKEDNGKLSPVSILYFVTWAINIRHVLSLSHHR